MGLNIKTEMYCGNLVSLVSLFLQFQRFIVTLCLQEFPLMQLSILPPNLFPFIITVTALGIWIRGRMCLKGIKTKNENGNRKVRNCNETIP